MGRNSVKITRTEAKEMILKIFIENKTELLNGMSNEELEDIALTLGFGESGELPYFGKIIEVANDILLK
jgi:hypothetical protein